MRKVLLILLALVLTFGLVACDDDDEPVQPDEDYNDGTYAASASGYGGDIDLEVVIADGRIDAINILSHQETDGIADDAFSGIVNQVVSQQSVAGVDAVSGATETSDALIEAIEDALAQAQ